MTTNHYPVDSTYHPCCSAIGQHGRDCRELPVPPVDPIDQARAARAALLLFTRAELIALKRCPDCGWSPREQGHQGGISADGSCRLR